jgi:hypothetical protein
MIYIPINNPAHISVSAVRTMAKDNPDEMLRDLRRKLKKVSEHA